MNDKDIKKKTSKKFDTTTRIPLNETFDAEDITLKDEIPEPEEAEGESVTQKLTKKEEISLVSAKLKMIVHGNGRFLAAIKGVGALVADVAIQCWRRSEVIWRDKKKRWIALSALLTMILVVIQVSWYLSSRPVSVMRPAVTVEKSGAGLQLTPLEFTAPDGAVLDPGAIRIGSSVFLNFYVMKWDAGKEEKLVLSADIRLYGGTGKLLLYKPRYAVYADKADPAADRILVKTRLDLARDMPLGFYRAVIQVTEAGTGKKAHQQGRFKLVP